MSDEKCTLHSKKWKQCCCNCKFHLPTHEHCTTNMALRKQIEKLTGVDKCICGIQIGWACAVPMDGGSGRIYVNWPEHSVGCEMYTAKPVESKEEKVRRVIGKLEAKNAVDAV